MSTSTSMSCQWISAAEVVRDIQAQHLNVTDAVAQCDNICQVVFEFNGPAGEMSGQGVRISYFIQVALACLFGILVPGIVKIIELSSGESGVRTISLLRKLQKTFYGFNAAFSASVLVATIFRYRQYPSAMEVVLIQCMSHLEFVINMVMACTAWFDLSMNEAKQSQSIIGWKLGVSTLVTASAAVIIVANTDPPHRTIYADFAKQCYGQRNFIDLTHEFTTPGNAIPKSIGIGLGIGIAINIGCVILAAILWRSKIIRRVINALPEWTRREWYLMVVTFILTYYIFWMINTTMSTESSRTLLNQASGNHYHLFNNWGHVQTAAIMVWGLFLGLVTRETFDHCRVPGVEDEFDSEKQQEKLALPPPQVFVSAPEEKVEARL